MRFLYSLLRWLSFGRAISHGPSAVAKRYVRGQTYGAVSRILRGLL